MPDIFRNRRDYLKSTRAGADDDDTFTCKLDRVIPCCGVAPFTGKGIYTFNLRKRRAIELPNGTNYRIGPVFLNILL